MRDIATLGAAPHDTVLIHTSMKAVGRAVTHPFRNHGRTGSENFGIFERPLVEGGALSYGKPGNATVQVVDAAKCRDILLGIYAKTDENLCLTRKEVPESLWKQPFSGRLCSPRDFGE